MTTFEVWAPNPDRVRLRAHGVDHEMSRGRRRLVAGRGPGRRPGTDYAFLLDDDDDPAARPPLALAAATACTAPAALRPRRVLLDRPRLDRAAAARRVLYELHVGTFTAGGTFDAAIERLDHLVELGVDLVEVLPVNAVDGARNWGYDGVGWYAVHEPYGGPDGFKRVRRRLPRRGLGGGARRRLQPPRPVGALPAAVRALLQRRRTNTWGDAVNLDGPAPTTVRRYVIDNALMWLRDYHVDGLRLDAVHALRRHRRDAPAGGAGRRGRGAVARTWAGRSR